MQKSYKPEARPALTGLEPGPKLKVDSSPGSPSVSDEMKALRFAVNIIVNHLDSKYSPGIFTPEEHVKMGVPVRE